MTAEALKAREEIPLPVRKGEDGQIVVAITGRDTCILLTQDDTGALLQETIPLWQGADRIRKFLAELELTPEMKASRELHGVPLEENVVALTRRGRDDV